MKEMTEREKYLFDLQGFLVVRDFLTPEEVAALNEAVDANADVIGEDGNSNIGDYRKRWLVRNVGCLPAC